MFKELKDFYIIEEFKEFGVSAVYTKKSAGNMSFYSDMIEEVTKNRINVLKFFNKESLQIVFPLQTHSINIVDIKEDSDVYFYEDVDGFITKRRDIALFTTYADCLPIYVYDKVNKVIGVAHSGWEGTYKEMMKSLLTKLMETYNTNLSEVVMGLGIGIQAKDYEVSKEFYDKFKNKFGDVDYAFNIGEKIYFDNTKFNRRVALELGILESNLIISNESTFDDKFHSFRRDAALSKRAAAIIFFD